MSDSQRQRCTACGREASAQVQFCASCGSSFSAVELESESRREAAQRLVRRVPSSTEELESESRREAAHSDLAWGLGLIVVGGGITIATYLYASGEGTYFVTWGAVIWGGIRLIRGLLGNASTTYRLGAIAVAATVLAIGLAVFQGPQVG